MSSPLWTTTCYCLCVAGTSVHTQEMPFIDSKHFSFFFHIFQPNFGASPHILKVEIGGDAQSTGIIVIIVIIVIVIVIINNLC